MVVSSGGMRVRPGAGWTIASERFFACAALSSNRPRERHREPSLVFRVRFPANQGLPGTKTLGDSGACRKVGLAAADRKADRTGALSGATDRGDAGLRASVERQTLHRLLPGSAA